MPTTVARDERYQTRLELELERENEREDAIKQAALEAVHVNDPRDPDGISGLLISIARDGNPDLDEVSKFLAEIVLDVGRTVPTDSDRDCIRAGRKLRERLLEVARKNARKAIDLAAQGEF